VDVSHTSSWPVQVAARVRVRDHCHPVRLVLQLRAQYGLAVPRGGRWRDYVVGEVSYITLSPLAKSLLAWLIFANVLRA
jgi:hypothetical protein